MTADPPPPSLEAKLVVLGSQGVGKTSLVHRYVKNTFIPPAKAQSTVGASFVTSRVQDPETGTTIRLQIWDTAGQERFRSISRLYYRGAHAAILCYDVTSKKSFDEMGAWLQELKDNCGSDAGQDMIIHVVGTKTDAVAQDPSLKEVPFERCINYIAEHLYTGTSHRSSTAVGGAVNHAVATPNSNRSSGFWGQEHVWDCCHEISAKDGEGIDEVFRVITRKLVEQHNRRVEQTKAIEEAANRGRAAGVPGQQMPGYFDLPRQGHGSFRLGHGDKRRSWMGFPTPSVLTSFGAVEGEAEDEACKGPREGRCC